jgi:hypothetical protein
VSGTAAGSIWISVIASFFSDQEPARDSIFRTIALLSRIMITSKAGTSSERFCLVEIRV